MKKILVLASAALLVGCGPKIKLVPQAYMPTPPDILMKDPKELNTIKNNNLTVTDKSVTVDSPEK